MLKENMKDIFNSDFNDLQMYIGKDWQVLTEKYGFKVVQSSKAYIALDFGVYPYRNDSEERGERSLLHFNLCNDGLGSLFVLNHFNDGAEIATVNGIIRALGLDSILKTMHGVLKFKCNHSTEKWQAVGFIKVIGWRTERGFE